MAENYKALIKSAAAVPPAFLNKKFEENPVFAKVFAGIGAFAVASATLKTFRYLFVPHVLPSRLVKFKHPYPRTGVKPWAIVTGASDGIGKGFAFELAAEGFDIVLCARNETKLNQVVAELKKEFPGTQTKLWVADAGTIAAEENKINFSELLDIIAGLPVTVLINNVGVANTLTPLETLSDSEIINVINVNTTFPTVITKYLIPTLELNGPSLVLNVGSFASELGLPYLSVYGGTKAYNKVWNDALHRELKVKNSKIQVQGLLVGEVLTNANPGKINFTKPSSRKFAKTALRVPTTQKTVAPYFWHKFSFGWFDVMPNFVRDFAAKTIARNFQKSILEGKKA